MPNTRIYKYEMDLSGATINFDFEMPMNAEVLTLQMQGDTPCIWARVDDGVVPTDRRRFTIYGTGHQILAGVGEGLHYIGTFQLGGFVGHVFEDTQRKERVYHEGA